MKLPLFWQEASASKVQLSFCGIHEETIDFRQKRIIIESLVKLVGGPEIINLFLYSAF